MINQFLRGLLVLSIVAVAYISIANEKISIDGTYVLESRALPDGTMIKPPEIIGLYNLNNGYINLNIIRRNNEDKVYSLTLVGKYKLSATEFYEERLFFMINDEIGNNGIKYAFEKLGASPVKSVGGKIEFSYPPDHDIHASFDGDKFTATKAGGSYIDNWIKLK